MKMQTKIVFVLLSVMLLTSLNLSAEQISDGFYNVKQLKFKTLHL